MPIYIKPITSDELYHYGRLGMKWGQHLYRNENGTLTLKGMKRFDKVASRPLLNKLETRRAINIYKHNDKGLERIGNKLRKKSEKLESKSKTALDNSKNKKSEKLHDKAIMNLEQSKKYLDQHNIYAQKISDIKDGHRKAGRDFITQKISGYDFDRIGDVTSISKYTVRQIINRDGSIDATRRKRRNHLWFDSRDESYDRR